MEPRTSANSKVYCTISAGQMWVATIVQLVAFSTDLLEMVNDYPVPAYHVLLIFEGKEVNCCEGPRKLALLGVFAFPR